ncbi:polyprenyl synthetase family protein [Cellulomonas soli]
MPCWPASPSWAPGWATSATPSGWRSSLVDDELGVFGDPAVTGKSTLSDLREGRRTELVRLAYQHADAAGRAVLDAELGRADLDEAGAAALRGVLVDSGALELTRALAARSAAQARELASATLPGPLAGYLGRVVDSLAGRGR